MKKSYTKRHKMNREAGQGIVEYLIIIALVGLAVVLIVNLMQPAIGAVFSDFIERSNVAPPDLVGFTRIPPTPTATPDTGATLTINIIGNGAVTTNPASPVGGDMVTLTANPDSGWLFAGWGDDLSGTINPETLLLDTDKTVTANFIEETFTLTVISFGAGHVEVNPEQVEYNNGDSVSLSAIPDAGGAFVSWGGDLSGSTNPAIITMDSDKNIEAYFQVGCYDLTVTEIVDIGGDVIVSPAPDCVGGTQYQHGTVVTLQANPVSGYVFDGWSGSLTGLTNPASLTMLTNEAVTANFTELLYTLTTQVSGNGSITVDPVQATYSEGETAALTAVPANPGSTFTGWSGDATGTANPVTITFDGDKNVTANFEDACYTLAAASSPVAGGSVTMSPTSSPGCNAGNYHYGENVTVTAVPSTGYDFLNWSGLASGTNASTTVTVFNNSTVTANFEIICYTLEALPNPTAGGTITPAPAPNCTAGVISGWTYGSNVTLTANANSGYSFESWNGDTDSTADNTATVLVNANKNVTANFLEAVVVEDFESGGWSGGSGWSGSWTHSSSDSTVTTTGTPYAGTYHLRLADNGWAERAADLSALTSGASLSFYWKVTTGMAVNEEWYVEISSDGGSNWDQVLLVDDSNENGTYSLFTFALDSSYLVSNFHIRFYGINANDPSDYFYVDNILITGN
ncbi:MAG: InlB B-repeat-containing protein [Ardenticatenaceae bacterium]|nr:InlB B-repeat-containing protein [Ardenticatenaceae bacterium]